MLSAQKALLKSLRGCEAEAAKLYGAGVKIGGIVQKLRAAAGELETRVKFLHKHGEPEPEPEPKKEPESTPPSSATTGQTRAPTPGNKSRSLN